MNNQAILANRVIEILQKSGQFRKVELIGSVAESRYDQFSDVDILITDDNRPPWSNVMLATEMVESEMGCILRDWAASLMPGKYLISHFLPNCPLTWWLDLSCVRSDKYHAITRADIPQNRNEHLAKLLVMNAKHYLRGTTEQLRIRELCKKVTNENHCNMNGSECFMQVYNAIDYSHIDPEFKKKTDKIIELVTDKSTWFS